MGCIRVDKITEYLCEPLRKCLKDEDPYVRKTAAVCVAKLHDINAQLVEDQGFLDTLKDLISDSNPMVRLLQAANQLAIEPARSLTKSSTAGYKPQLCLSLISLVLAYKFSTCCQICVSSMTSPLYLDIAGGCYFSVSVYLYSCLYLQVVANAVAALSEIAESHPNSNLLDLNPQTINKLLTALNECTEWGQIFILDCLANYTPRDDRESQR